jgi:hypothetical protein
MLRVAIAALLLAKIFSLIQCKPRFLIGVLAML